MCRKLTIATSKTLDTKSNIEVEVQAKKLGMGILRKIEEGKKSIDEDAPYPPEKNKTEQTSPKSTISSGDLLAEENQTEQERLTLDK
jgi:hypothetical protein